MSRASWCFARGSVSRGQFDKDQRKSFRKIGPCPCSDWRLRGQRPLRGKLKRR